MVYLEVLIDPLNPCFHPLAGRARKLAFSEQFVQTYNIKSSKAFHFTHISTDACSANC